VIKSATVAQEEALEPSRPPLPPELRRLLVNSLATALVADYRRRHTVDGGVPVSNEPKGSE
jgi:hypothetical protein